MNINDLVHQATKNTQAQSQELQRQFFQQNEINKIISSNQAQTDEIVRTLKQYNDMVERFYNETNEKIKKEEKNKIVWSCINTIIALAGVIASIIIGIYF